MGIPSGASGMMVAKRALHMYADKVFHHPAFGLTEMRYNLHVLLCVLPRQVIYRGFSPASMLEFFIERAVQWYIKQPVAGRVTSNFGMTQCKAVLRHLCCQRARFLFPELADKVDDVVQDRVHAT